MKLRALLLGSPIVDVDGAPIVVDTRKAIAILAYLACSDGPVPRETLTYLLWPDYAPERARAALRRTLSALRKGLGNGMLGTNRLAAWLVTSEDTEIDVAVFAAAVADIEHAEAAELDKAAQLYRGDFLAGFSVRGTAEFDDWQQTQSAHYRRLATAAMDRLALMYAESGQFAAAIAVGSRRLDLDLLHEPAHRRLMMLNATAGNRPAAIQNYQRCVRVLDEELGVAPLEETSDLYRRILDGSVKTAPSAREPTIGLAPVGEQQQRPGFVGRRTELEAMRAALDSSRESLRVVFVEGEPGLGKTRLIDEFIAGLGAEAGVVRARCYEGEGAVAHGASIALLRSALDHAGDVAQSMDPAALAEAARLAPEIATEHPGLPVAPPLDSPGGYLRMLEGVACVVVDAASINGAGVVVVDDAHWADDDSLQVVARIVRHRSAQPGLVVIANRGGGITADHPLSVILREAERAGIASTIRLSRLSRSEVAELVGPADNPDLADEVFRLSEGVPLFAVEYLAVMRNTADTDAPPSVIRELLAGLVSQRSELGAQLLEAAAVIGRSFDFETLRAASGRSEEEALRGLDELVGSHLVRETGAGSFDFDHERIRSHVYDSMTMMRRRLLHGRVADAMPLRDDDAASMATAAEHLLASGQEAEAATRYLASAEAMTRIYANDQALRHYDTALALGHPDSGVIREAVGDLLALRGDYAAAITNLNAAAGDAAGPRKASLLHKIAVVYTRAGDWDLAEDAFAAAVPLADGSGSLETRLLTDWAWLWHRRGDDHRARDLAGRALASAESFADSAAVSQALNVLGIIERGHDIETALSRHLSSLELVAETDVISKSAALNNLALTYLASGDPALGLEAGLEALQLIEKVGDRHKTAALHSNVADLYRACGRDEDSRRHARISAEMFAELGAGGLVQPEIWMLSDW